LKYFYLTIAAFLAVVGSVQAQQSPNKARSGSVYSYLGLGAPIDYRSSAAEGMGMSGVALYDDYVPGLANPAYWGNTVYTTATGGVFFQNYDARDNNGHAKNSLISASQFQLVLPLKRNRVGLSLSLSPLTRSNFKVVDQTVLPPALNNGRDTLAYSIQNQGDGGLNRLELGIGVRIYKNISIGYAPSLIYGPLQNNLKVHFVSFDPNVTYNDITYDQTTTNIGFGNRFGVYGTQRKIFSKKDALSFGAAVSLPINLKSERYIESDRALGQSVKTFRLKDKDAFGTGDIRYPMEIMAGLQYAFNPALGVGTELLYQNWSDYTNFDGNQEAYMTDRYKIALGARYRPFMKRVDTFFSHFKYRLGASYDSGYLKLNGQQIETLKLSAGLGILSPRNRSSVDISLEYGIRGTRSQNLVKENIWGLRLSINLAELMFYRPKLQ